MAVADYALATLNEIKDYYQFASKGRKQIDDDLLEDLSNRVSIMFQTYCGITSFKSTDYTEYQDGFASKYLFVNNVPINSVAEINEDSDWDWASDTTIAADSYRIIDGKYIVIKDTIFAAGDQSIKITYNAGYDSIPLDLKQVCIEEVVRRFKHRKDFDVVAKSMEDGSVNYSEKGLLTGTKQVLDRYKNNWVF